MSTMTDEELNTEPCTLTREDQIRELANQQYCRDDGPEIDDDSKVSESDDENGAYVQAWVWVDFAGTDLDREKPSAGE